MLESIIPMQADPGCLYVLHQNVAALLQHPEQQSRNYLYAHDAGLGALYVRMDSPPEHLRSENWRVMSLPAAGQVVRLSGLLRIDTSASRQRSRLRFHHDPEGPSRAPARRDPHDIVKRRLAAVGDVIDLSLTPGDPTPFGKPGMGDFSMTPLHLMARLRVRNTQAMERLLGDGLGQSKAFGFGVIHWSEVEP